jgi:hypothetical protein
MPQQLMRRMCNPDAAAVDVAPVQSRCRSSWCSASATPMPQQLVRRLYNPDAAAVDAAPVQPGGAAAGAAPVQPRRCSVRAAVATMAGREAIAAKHLLLRNKPPLALLAVTGGTGATVRSNRCHTVPRLGHARTIVHIGHCVTATGFRNILMHH